MNIFPQTEKASRVFGHGARSYGPLINEISRELLSENYKFEDINVFEARIRDPNTGRIDTGKIYWEEILQRSHMSSVAAILRTTRWVDVAVREYEASSLFGWASACRSLIESAGDIVYSLGAVPLTLAENHRQIMKEITGVGSDEVFISSELEDSLIHFTHARKVSKNEETPNSHKAEPPWKYLKSVEQMNIDRAKELYATLCEIVHPTSASVAHFFFALKEGNIVASTSNDATILQEINDSYQDTLSQIPSASFNPPLLIIRVLHKFKLFNNIRRLRKYRFDEIPLWRRIEQSL